MTDHADLFSRAEMRWMSVENSEMKVRARTLAEIGREMASRSEILRNGGIERAALQAERDEALRSLASMEASRVDVIQQERMETAHFVARAEAAEAEVARLRARLADADEIIDDCWHQFAIDIRGKLSPGGLSTLEMVDDYRNTRDGLAAPTKENHE